MPLSSFTKLQEILRDPARPAFVMGTTPPREGTSIEMAEKTCEKFLNRSAALATDGFIVYDIQEEKGRTDVERPFPFRKTLSSSWYASLIPKFSGKQCVVYKSVVEESIESFDEWLDEACIKHKHSAFNLVGAATSRVAYKGPNIQQAALHVRKRSHCYFGCVCIPERHMTKGGEPGNMLQKMNWGADWFITQGVYSVAPIIKLINEYGDLCKKEKITPKKMIITFAPCGRPKTMQFIKWLGILVPPEVEERILTSSNPVQESVILLKEFLVTILEQTGGSGVPLGINVESLSIFKEEIDAAHTLFQTLQTTMLNHRGSPWAVQWFCVRQSQEISEKLMNDVNVNGRAGVRASITDDGGWAGVPQIEAETQSQQHLLVQESNASEDTVEPSSKAPSATIPIPVSPSNTSGRVSAIRTDWIAVASVSLLFGFYLGRVLKNRL